MKINLFLLFVLGFLFSSCEQNPIWVGNKEFLTFSYSYNAQSGPTISEEAVKESPFIHFDATSAVDLGNGDVKITIDGVRVQSNVNNFTISDFTVFEKDDNNFDEQNEFENNQTSETTDIAAVLVLDMSTSLIDLAEDLKIYANSFVDEVVNSTPNSKVAVVFFSGKNDIAATAFFDASNANTLKSEITNFNNYQPRTALFQASVEGINLLDALPFDGAKALVVFTDGGDNDSDNPSSLKTLISDSEYLRISIGLKGEDFDKDDLEDIADSNANSIIVKKEGNLEKVFETVSKQIVSIYQIVYLRSSQALEETIEIKFKFDVDKI